MIIRVLSRCVHAIPCAKEVDMSRQFLSRMPVYWLQLYDKECEINQLSFPQIVQPFPGNKVVLQVGVSLDDTHTIHGFQNLVEFRKLHIHFPCNSGSRNKLGLGSV